MKKYFERRFAMSPEGATDFQNSIIMNTIFKILTYVPTLFALFYLSLYFGSSFTSLFDFNEFSANPLKFVLIAGGFGLLAFLIMFLVAKINYHFTFAKIYFSSAQSRIKLAENLRKLPLAYFEKQNVADLSGTIMQDVTTFEQVFSHSLPQLISSIITIFIVAIVMFVFDWRLAIGGFWVVLISLAITLFAKKLNTRGFKDIYKAKREFADYIQEGIESAQEIKSYNQEEIFQKKLDTSLDSYEKLLFKSELVGGVGLQSAHIFLKFGLASFTLVGTYLLGQSLLNPFTFLAFLVVFTRVFDGIFDAMLAFMMFLFLDTMIDRMREMNDMPKQTGVLEFTPNGFDIVFENVNFAYKKDVNILENINFTAKQGEVTALIGSSGSGKSTLAKLAARFWDINSGSIKIGGVDISKIEPEVLLQNFSIVFQEVLLFNASVLENIRLGRKDATDAEVMAAAKLAQCDEFVQKLPQGYETLVGENGEKLSGGERQRISIARALLKNANIILLDEATASLDGENESKIQLAISELIKNKTVLIIAHRMRTVVGANKIVAIEKGKIAEEGTPEALKAQGGIFAKMLKQQQEV